MSWQTYIDEHLMCDIDGQHLTASAILGHDGSVWAQSATFPQVSSFSPCRSRFIAVDHFWFLIRDRIVLIGYLILTVYDSIDPIASSGSGRLI